MELPSRHERLIAAAICAAFALQCLGYALLLPPFEEFDATAHFSYVSLLADRGEIPDFRATPLDARIEEAILGLPQSYAGQPPYDSNGGLTYAQFFAQCTPAEQQVAAERYWRLPLPSEYQPGLDPNWQGQHPPLFYAIMALPYRLTAGQPLGVQLTALRLASVALACGSALFWWLTLRRLSDRGSRLTWLAGGATILAIPSCWFDLGRFGNDSLAACCLAAIVYFLLRVADGGGGRDLALLGTACICGLLTKAFFVPITAATILYVAVSGARRDGWRRASCQSIALMVFIALGAGWWFALYAARYGTPLGSHETWMAAQQSSFAGDALPPAAFVFAMLRSAAACGATFLWCGTWSWVRRPDWHYLLMLPLVLLCLSGAWRGLRQKTHHDSRRLQIIALVLVVPFLCGLASHIVLRVRVNGIGAGTPGYYLFFAWPLVGVLLSGFWNCFDSRRGRCLGALALLSATLMEWSGVWFCLQVYAGIITKTGYTTFGVGGILPTSENIALVVERLELLCFPRAALFILILGLFVKTTLWIAVAQVLSRTSE